MAINPDKDMSVVLCTEPFLVLRRVTNLIFVNISHWITTVTLSQNKSMQLGHQS